jgi:hypothetical protein
MCNSVTGFSIHINQKLCNQYRKQVCFLNTNIGFTYHGIGKGRSIIKSAVETKLKGADSGCTIKQEGMSYEKTKHCTGDGRSDGRNESDWVFRRSARRGFG